MLVTEKATALRARGIAVVDLGAGEPDFDTPQHIKDAAARAMRDGQTKYTPVAGTAALKAAIVTKLQRDNQLTYGPSEVVACCGGKHALYLAFQALFGTGDAVLVPAPFWVSYPDMLVLAGAEPIIVRTSEERDFKLTPAELDAAITPRTRALILNSPSNPTGAAYHTDELAGLLEVVVARNLSLICDDVYEMMIYGAPRPSHPLLLHPALRDRTLIVNSVSKTYAMTGWRIGYSAGPAPIIKAMTTLQGQMTSNPSSIAQAAAAQALAGPQEAVSTMIAEFARRGRYVVDRLRTMPRVRCNEPQGAFYVFPNVSAYLEPHRPGLKTGDDLAAYLLESSQVAVVGGTDFGAPEHIRISYATSMDNLRDGLNRIEGSLAALS